MIESTDATNFELGHRHTDVQPHCYSPFGYHRTRCTAMSQNKKPAVGEIHEVDLREDYSPVGVNIPPPHPTSLDLSHTMAPMSFPTSPSGNSEGNPKKLEAQIEQLRETQRKYSNMLRLARALTNNFHQVVQTQQTLGEAFADLAQKSPELQEEFLCNSETQRNLTGTGEILLNALNLFVSSVNTLCNKTIEDTLVTVRQYENARVEYDAYRTDLELLLQVTSNVDSNCSHLDEAQRNFQTHRENFEKLRNDVVVKLRFLDENRIKVMHKQLLLFHNAISAYFSGNEPGLQATLKQFNIKTNKIPSQNSMLYSAEH
ncbi:hypothetical protein M8J75_009738 [Diaphorina citri]|nr:hypothetical protein M8J75_009738 [Diaphorina citri]